MLVSVPFLALCIGCAKEPTAEVELPNSDLIPLNISGSISQVQTKATAEGFVDKDALGLFAVNYSGNNTVAGTLITEGNQADNVKYVFDETNQKWNPVKAVYYKDVNTNADLYVYYPFQSSINDVNAANFEVKQDQSSPKTETELSGYEASDFLWGKASNIAPSEAKVAISLFHKLSSVQVTLVEGTGFDESEFADLEKSLILTNTTRKATIDYATGEATPLGNPQLNGIVMCPQEDGAFRAIVIPQTVTGGEKLFAITLGGTSYSFSQSADVTYQAGKQMNVSITVNKKVPTGEYEFVLADTQIVDWVEDRNTHGGEARQYFVVNIETPGTLGKVLRAAKKNPHKIRNLKVVGTINAWDYYFMRDSMQILEAINLKEAVSRYYVGNSGSEYFSYTMGYDTDFLKNYGELVYSDNQGCQIVPREYAEESGIEDAIPNNAFYGKSSLYYFVFPQGTTKIGDNAFNKTRLSGALTLPEDVSSIGYQAFQSTNISSVYFPESLQTIGHYAFQACSSLTGSLLLPNGVVSIGQRAFCECNFNGTLSLPNSLMIIESEAFLNAGSFYCSLTIPEYIKDLPRDLFGGTHFSGTLDLNNVQTLGSGCFSSCGFSGDLVVPEGVTIIPDRCFEYDYFVGVSFPSTLKEIQRCAFKNNTRLFGGLSFPEGLVILGEYAFEYCVNINSIELPSTLQTIQSFCFENCVYVCRMSSAAIVPPTVFGGAFNGISKDNFALEVPGEAVNRYKSQPGWSDFKRISNAYDFSISKGKIRSLNSGITKKLIIRAPSNMNWSIDMSSIPEWVNVTPLSGTGRVDISVSIEEMQRTENLFEIETGVFPNIFHSQIKGRKCDLIFILDETDATCSLEIEQFDSDRSDGEVLTYNTSSKEHGIDVVFIGDGYDAYDIASGEFETAAMEGFNHLFSVEPYKSYKDYFNVYAVVSQSDESGLGTVNTIVDNKFGSYFAPRILIQKPEDCFLWAKKANPLMDISKSLVIMLQNTSVYEGVTLMYGDGSAIACCPVSTEAYPYDFRGIIQHEAGGHGFGKLADEYIYTNAFIQMCGCDYEHEDEFNNGKNHGWYQNLSLSNDPNTVPWSHLIYNPQYSNYVDMYEGGFFHTRGVFRSEATSCMNNNIPYFSAISRQAIVERIMEYAGEEFTLEKFYAKDSNEFGTKAAEPVSRKYVPEQIPFDGRERNIPIYMGEHPEL